MTPRSLRYAGERDADAQGCSTLAKWAEEAGSPASLAFGADSLGTLCHNLGTSERDLDVGARVSSSFLTVVPSRRSTMRSSMRSGGC